MTKKKRQFKTEAFSLVELILYVAISSIIVVSMLLFSIQILEVRSDAEFDREVLENARFVLDLASREIHDAEALDTGTFGSHPGSLTLDTDGGGTWTMSTDTKTVGSNTIRYIQIDDGGGNEQVTSDLVNVTNFVVNNLTRSSERSNIQIEMSIESLDGLSSADFQTSVSLRQ